MRKNSVKNTRINQEVLKELSVLIRTELKDPRVNPLMTSIVACEVAPDLKTAKIYVSVLGDEQAQADAVKGLKSAAPFLRGKLAKSLNLRNTPQLFFTVDQSIEYGVRMSHLIDEEIAKIPEREEEEEEAADDEW